MCTHGLVPNWRHGALDIESYGVRVGSNSAVRPVIGPLALYRRQAAFLLQKLGHFCFNGRLKDGSESAPGKVAETAVG